MAEVVEYECGYCERPGSRKTTTKINKSELYPPHTLKQQQKQKLTN